MPLKYFICPSGQKYPIEDCLERCHRKEGRCMALPLLVRIGGDQRAWKGRPSVTQLLNGTRHSYLQLTQDYATDPDGRMFMLIGIDAHSKISATAEKISGLSEEWIGTEEIGGIMDYLERDEEITDREAYVLYDYKTIGSFGVCKYLGMVQRGKRPDPSGEVYKTNSKYGKKGDPKMINVFGRDPRKVDMWQVDLQVNMYRLLIEKIGFPVSRMLAQAILRDGGLAVARNRGLDRNSYLVEIKRLPDKEVTHYFRQKREALLNAMENGHLPVECTERERWDGRRCEAFCDVVYWCPEGLERKRKVDGSVKVEQDLKLWE